MERAFFIIYLYIIFLLVTKYDRAIKARINSTQAIQKLHICQVNYSLSLSLSLCLCVSPLPPPPSLFSLCLCLSVCLSVCLSRSLEENLYAANKLFSDISTFALAFVSLTERKKIRLVPSCLFGANETESETASAE